LWPVRAKHAEAVRAADRRRSTFQQTVARIVDPTLFGRPIVITSADFRFIVAEQLRALGIDADIVLEPMRRDSGPAVAVAIDLYARCRSRTSIWSVSAWTRSTAGTSRRSPP
jgi:mannose-1-phosphate guanylyltransferase